MERRDSRLGLAAAIALAASYVLSLVYDIALWAIAGASGLVQAELASLALTLAFDGVLLVALFLGKGRKLLGIGLCIRTGYALLAMIGRVVNTIELMDYDYRFYYELVWVAIALLSAAAGLVLALRVFLGKPRGKGLWLVVTAEPLVAALLAALATGLQYALGFYGGVGIKVILSQSIRTIGANLGLNAVFRVLLAGYVFRGGRQPRGKGLMWTAVGLGAGVTLVNLGIPIVSWYTKGYLPDWLSYVAMGLSLLGLGAYATAVLACLWAGETPDRAENQAKPVYQAPVQQAYQQPVRPVYQQPVRPVYQQPVQPVYQAPVQPVAVAAKPEPKTLDQRLENLAKLKALLDSGAITQEEFEAMKQDAMKS